MFHSSDHQFWCHWGARIGMQIMQVIRSWAVSLRTVKCQMTGLVLSPRY
ncbi:hypothetical protein GJA_590 [Janthinobacterium agaricidamnosum NBRC 102515 = DSM 9628]|uniref:Uncharacterized protein n=1 Tax=Janthinobacterium agaricidamnosum NBRC 102515 = DSM 9628 TaxID=1349767 RepID=W0UXH0_9BURK|nr:hypothetical protein GJA_590 [Janthinobacterium agaricidamnosum NBRC 102515 = DSM 9628]